MHFWPQGGTMPGSLLQANSESIDDLKRLLARVGDEYAKPAIKLVASLAGVPEPLQDMFLTTIKNCADAYRRNDSEEAEFRAGAAIGMAAHCAGRPNQYTTVSPERIRTLSQRLTRKAIEIRVEEVVRVIVAATLGGSDTQIATPADLQAAEWLESLKDSQLLYLRQCCSELFPNEALQPYLQAPEPYKFVSAKFKSLPTTQAVDSWRNAAPSWPQFSKELFRSVGGLAYCDEAMQLWGCKSSDAGEFYSNNQLWRPINYMPSNLLQRAHNAFVRAEEAMKYELRVHAT